MVVHRFQTPDGKIHRVEAPTREAAEAELNRVLTIAPQARGDYARGRSQGGRHMVGGLQTFDANIPLMDEFKAGGQAVLDTMTRGGSLRENYGKQRAWQQGARQAYQEQHPLGANVARGLAYDVQAIPMFLTGGATAAPALAETAAPNLFTRAAPVLKNATIGGAYAAGNAFADQGSFAERTKAAGDAVLPGMAIGAAAPMLLNGMGAVKRGAQNAFRPKVLPEKSAGRVLQDIGVSTSPIARLGPTAKAAEDLGKRVPILGSAQRGYQGRQLEQLNRGVGLKALEPIGEGIPKNIKPGFDMVDYVDGRIGAQYDRATDMVPRVTIDPQFQQDFATIAARKADLSEGEAKLFDSIMRDRLNRLRGGEATGQTMKDIQSELRALQSEQARKGNTTLASMIGGVRQSLMGTVARANPEAAAIIQNADKAWRRYSIMNDAAAAASNRGGVFLPSQLGTQVRADAKAQGTNMAGKGKGAMQEISTAANALIPDSYGNPGTADALLAGGGLTGAGYGLATNPVATVGAVGAVGAVSTPYFLAGRKILEALPDNAGQAQVAAAMRQIEELAARDPKVIVLRDALARRFAPTATTAQRQAR